MSWNINGVLLPFSFRQGYKCAPGFLRLRSTMQGNQYDTQDYQVHLQNYLDITCSDNAHHR